MKNHNPQKFKIYLDRFNSQSDPKSDYALELLGWALYYAPLDLLEVLHEEKMRQDMILSATHVDDAGNPVFSYQQAADMLGVPVSEIKASNEKMIKSDPEFAPVGRIHRMHRPSNVERVATRHTAEIMKTMINSNQ